jgi:hypothetical protein
MLVMPNGLQPKKTEPLNQREIEWLSVAEDVCRKLNLTIACPRCLTAGAKMGAVLRGNNDVGDKSLSVTCDCRHLVFHLRAD